MGPGARKIARVVVWIAVVGAAACFALAGWVAWRLQYGLPLVVDVRPGEVVVATRRLGEYGSEVSRIRLSRDRDDVTVWEAVSNADDGTSLLWEFTLDPGPNAPPEGARAGFRTRVPVAGDLFQVEVGQRYRIDVWGSSSLRHGVSRFVAPAPRVTSDGALSRHALLTADWRLFGGVFEIAPDEGYPMRFAENGTFSSETLVGVDRWSLESGVLRLSGGGTTMYELTWLPDARAFRACAVPMPPLVIVPSGRSLKDVLDLRCTRHESGTSGHVVAPNR